MKYWWVPTRADDISLDFSCICICAALYLYICILFSIWSTGEGSGDENLQMTFGLHAFTAACAAAVGIERPKSKKCQDAKGKEMDQNNWQKVPGGPKIETEWKNPENQKNDMTDEIGATRLTMQSWQLLIMFTSQDNNDTIYNIDMIHNVDNVDKMLAKCYFYTLPTWVNFFLHFLIVIGFTF